MTKLPPPPPVPRDECPTVAPLRDPEADAIVRELDALRAGLRDVCRPEWPRCDRCGAYDGEPCDVMCGDPDAWEWT